MRTPTKTPIRSRWLSVLWLLAFLSLPVYALANNFLTNGIVSGTGLPLPGTKVNVANPPNIPANQQVTATEFNTVTGALTDVQALYLDAGLGGSVAANGIFSPDAGTILMLSPYDTPPGQGGTGPTICDGGNGYCGKNAHYTSLGKSLVLHDDGSQIVMCNTNNWDAYPQDGGYCVDIYMSHGGVGSTGMLEFNLNSEFTIGATTQCQMDLFGLGFYCGNYLQTGGALVAPQVSIEPISPEAFDFEFRSGVDVADAGRTALYLFSNVGNGHGTRNMYVEDPFDLISGSGFNDWDWSGVVYMTNFPPLVGNYVADAGHYGTVDADGGAVNALTVNALTVTGTNLVAGSTNASFNAIGLGGGNPGAAQQVVGCGNAGLQILNSPCGEVAFSAGTRVGGNGSDISNVGVGSCALAVGTCNAVVPGAKGNSLCYCDVQGGNWAVDAGSFTCHARADAGSATVWVQAGATPLPSTPTVGVHCDN